MTRFFEPSSCVLETVKPHQYTTGEQVHHADIGDMPGIDGVFPVTVPSANTYSIPLDTSNTAVHGVYNAELGPGTALSWIDPDDLLTGVCSENAPDIDNAGGCVRAVRIGLSYNTTTSSYDGKKFQAHGWNLPEQGEVLAAYRLGGDNSLSQEQVDGPFRWGFWFINGRNQMLGCSVNYGALISCDGYATSIRLESGASVRVRSCSWKSTALARGC